MKYVMQVLFLLAVIGLGTTFIANAYAQEDAEPSSMNDIPDGESLMPAHPALLAILPEEGFTEDRSALFMEPDFSQFDMETGDVFEPLSFGTFVWIVSWNPYANDASTLFATTLRVDGAIFDATAPYHPTAVGMYSRIDNRPASESETRNNINLATLHAFYQTMLKLVPEREDVWRDQVEQLGSDPDDTSGLDLRCDQKHELESPVAIGNLAAKCAYEGRQNDGFNYFGYETGGQRMADTTGFATVNTPYELVDPSRWQPLVLQAGGLTGKYAAQHFVTPQYANTEPYADFDPRSIRVPPPIHSNHEYAYLYKAQADEVLQLTAHLNDTQKAYADFFDNKFRDVPLFHVNTDLMEQKQITLLFEMVQFDAGIVAWQEKARYDAVRPVTAIGHLYGDEPVKVTSVARTGASEIPASQWYSYLPTSDHPEYPSGTSCFCAAFAELSRLYTGSDTIHGILLPNGEVLPGYEVPILAGSSFFEPGISPSEDTFISFESWSDYEQKCAESRIYGGVHFRAAVDASIDACRAVAQPVYEYWQSLIDGTAPMRGPAQPLDPDPLLDITRWTGR